MRAVIQRVSHASVSVNNQIKSSIEVGYLVLLGIEKNDFKEDADYLSKKIAGLRIMADDGKNMNLSVDDVNGEVLVVSQFTLHAKTKKGNRPSFIDAAGPEQAIPLYEYFIDSLNANLNSEVKTGSFGDMMQIDLQNDGPVTIIIDSKNK